MEMTIVPACAYPRQVRALFTEYTDMLVAGEPAFKAYLDLQNYDGELEHLEAKYGEPFGRLYLACRGEEVLGCIGLRKLDADNCELKRLYVRPAFRGQGLGRVLVERIIADAREIGYKHMLLDTLPFLKTAIAMYQTMGFYEVESYNNSPMENLIYLKLDL